MKQIAEIILQRIPGTETHQKGADWKALDDLMLER